MNPSALSRCAIVLCAAAALLLGGCAAFREPEPLEAYVADVEPLAGEGLEVRMLVKLRLQNPNETPLEFNGVALEMQVQGRPFATGVSDASGVVPRYGETVVAVPVSLSVFGMARRAVDILADTLERRKLMYELTGKLARGDGIPVYFKSNGEFVMPEGIFGRP